MKITVRKATEADIAKLRNNPTWGLVSRVRELLAHATWL